MARPPHAAATGNGWQRPGAERDARNGHAAPGQQPGPATGYPVYGDQQGGQAYDPQYGYHYPQQGHSQPIQRGLSSLDRGNLQPGPTTQPPYGQQTQPGYGQQPQQPQQPYYGYGQPGAPSYAQQGRQAVPTYEQWSQGAPQQEPGYDLGGFHPAGQHADPLQAEADWALAGHSGYGELAPAEAYPNGHYDQTHAGALEQAYALEEQGDYGAEPKRGSWMLRIAGAIVVAVGLGYGLAQGYKLVSGPASDGATPVVRGEGAPSRTLPDDPGGRQFSNTDAKVMGRLGEGTTTSAETGSLSGPDSGTETGSDGTRKVRPLVVRPDGTIVPPGAPAETAGEPVAVPGVTVIDAMGGGGFPGTMTTTTAQPHQAPEPPQETAQEQPVPARKPAVVTPPAAAEPAPEVVARAEPDPTPAPAAAPQEPAPAPEVQAAATPSPPPEASSGAGDGYVVVLASVPASDQSRLAALKRFADMQQQYGSVLQNRTPDVREANLGAKGIYHRLLVGPPGSRAQASALCRDLKAAGYKDCWVTAY